MPETHRSRTFLGALLTWLVLAGVAAGVHAAPAAAPAAKAPAKAAPGAKAAAPKTGRPKIALVLAGGGARGAAHVGVIEVLEEMRIPVDIVAGTSMGAVVGGLYASGIEAHELRTLLAEMPWESMFSDRTRRRDMAFRRKQDDRNFLSDFNFGFQNGRIQVPTGLIQGQRLEFVLGQLLLPVATQRDFDRLTIPFRAVATDIVTGRPVVLADGELVDAIRASMAIPGAFAPVELDGRLLVDGGSSMNLPVQVAREMGADVIIAVDISTPLRTREEITSALSITGQTIGMQIQQNVEGSIALLDENDVLLRPELGQVTTMSFGRVLEAADYGAEAANAVRDFLSRLSVDEETYAAYRASLPQPDRSPPVIDSIRVDNGSGLSDEVLVSRMKLRDGQPLDFEVLTRDIDILFGMDLFDHVKFRIDEVAEGKKELVLVVRERATGRNRVRLGFALETDFASSGLFNIGVNVTRQPLNRLGAEWRNQLQIGQDPGLSTELWQPIDHESRWFVAPTAEFQATTLGVFDETLYELVPAFGDVNNTSGIEFAQYRVNNVGVGLGFGRQLGQWGEIRAGIEFDYLSTEVQVGFPGVFPQGDQTDGEVFVRMVMDTLDDARFPTDGTLAFAQAAFGFTEIGSEVDYQYLSLAVSHAESWGKNTVLFETQTAFSFDSKPALGNLRALGGFLRLSGLKPNERLGTDLLFFRVRGYRRVAKLGLLSFQLPAYVGVSIEAGNTFFGTDAISIDRFKWGGSVYFALDTPLAPIYLAYGNTDGHRNAAYFYVGQAF